LNNLQTPIIDDRLLFRRQYFIGPKFIDQFPKWNKNAVGQLCITTHPDLGIEKVKNGNIELLLLGFAFDFKNPLFTNNQVLKSIIYKVKSFNDLILATYQLSGRWIIIYSNGSELKLLNDPAGLRQVFYYRDGEDTWCSAQPHLLA